MPWHYLDSGGELSTRICWTLHLVPPTVCLRKHTYHWTDKCGHDTCPCLHCSHPAYIQVSHQVTIPEDKAPTINTDKHNWKTNPLGSIFIVVISYSFGSCVSIKVSSGTVLDYYVYILLYNAISLQFGIVCVLRLSILCKTLVSVYEASCANV